MVGVIEDDKELICTDCLTIIPNCISCSSNSTCDLCTPGYQLTNLKDAFGNTNQLCLSHFCGVVGDGEGCQPNIPDVLDNCVKSD